MANILLVDDDIEVTRVLLCLLKFGGHNASAMNTGTEALEHLETVVPHLILLDYMMPEMDGIEVLKQLRARDLTAKCAIIIYTAVEDPRFAAFARSCGADDVWVKGSVPFEEFERQVKAYTSR